MNRIRSIRSAAALLAAAAAVSAAVALSQNQAAFRIEAGRYAGARPGVNVLVGGTESLTPPEAEQNGIPWETVLPADSIAESVPEAALAPENAESIPEAAALPEAAESIPEAAEVPENAESVHETGSPAENGENVTETASPDRPEEMAVVPVPGNTDETWSSPESMAETPAGSAESMEIRLGFAGDINFDESWPTTQYMDREGGIEAVFSQNLFDLMRGFDIFMVNNEFTYSTRGEETDKTYHFRANPSRVSNLHTLGADIVLLANNHVFDYGEDALLDTLDTLDAAGIPYVGAGRNIEEAKRPYYFTVNGRKIAYVAASSAEEYTPSIATRAADEDESGILACYDPSLFLEVIGEAAEEADYVIASVHWGMEYESEYYDSQRELAERMISAGADAIIGTHTHCLQGINFIEGKPVFYSLGNYWFNEKDLYTGLAELTLNVPSDPGQPVTLTGTRFYPCTQYDLYTEMPEDEGGRAVILDHLESISNGSVEIDGEGFIHPAA